jgi:hypothetical protein
LLEVPARRFAAAGVEDKTSVAASPEGCPSVPEILKFFKKIVCWFVIIVCNVF